MAGSGWAMTRTATGTSRAVKRRTSSRLKPMLQKFGAIIKNALAPNAFISVAACGSAGSNNDFIKALQAATGAIVIGTPDGCRSGGNWLSGAWWECDKGRVQINKDATTKVDASDDGKGIWKPF